MLSQDISSEDEEENESKRRKGKIVDKQNDNQIKCEENDENIDNNINDREEDVNNIIIDDKNDKKLNRKVLVPTKKSPFSVYLKEDLLSVLRNAFAFHRLSCGAKLMHALSLDMRTPHFVIMRAALILFTQNVNNFHNNNNLLTQSMKKISKYDINRREIMLEMIINYLQNDNRIAAKEYIKANETYIKLNLYRSHPIIDTYLKCYICYCDYLEWKQSIHENIHSIYYRSYDSSKIIGDKTKLSLKNIITDNKDCRLDIFVLILLEMYEHSQQYNEAIDLLELYVNQNTNYLNANIYLYNFCVKYSDYTTPQQLLNALTNICRLSPESQLVLELVNKNILSVEDNFELIMEFIDYTANSHDINAWSLLKDTLNNIDDNGIADRIINIWRQRYKSYWLRIHFNVSQINLSHQKLIRCKQMVIIFLESPSHKYVSETNKLFKKFK